MDNEYNEYSVFTVTTSKGEQAELAIVDEFDLDGKHYVAAALVVDDTISDEGVYVYRTLKQGEETEYLQIQDPEEYSRVAEAYAAMSED